MKSDSLGLRLNLAAAAVLLIALAIAGFGLVMIFDKAIEQQAIEELERHIKALSAHVAWDANGGLSLDQQPTDSRFQTPYDGLYWQIEAADRALLRSRSLWDTKLAIPQSARSGSPPSAFWFAGPNDSQALGVERVIQIKGRDGGVDVTIVAALDRRQLDATRATFLRLLTPALALLGVALMLALAAFIGIGLSPFRRLQAQVAALRQGRSRALTGRYPREVQPLVTELNRFIATQDEMLLESRRQAADLVHGLKTPIAVLQAVARNLDAERKSDIAKVVVNQTELLDRHVRRALARARAGVTAAMSRQSLDLAPVLWRLVNAMRVLGSEREIQWNIKLDCQARAPGDEVDMMELFGNILDNARQWAKSRVDVTTTQKDENLIVTISDDGPGLPDEKLLVPQRGVRWDQTQGGSGFGLAISRDISETYRGSLSLTRARLGGLEVTIRLPPPSADDTHGVAANIDAQIADPGHMTLAGAPCAEPTKTQARP